MLVVVLNWLAFPVRGQRPYHVIIPECNSHAKTWWQLCFKWCCKKKKKFTRNDYIFLTAQMLILYRYKNNPINCILAWWVQYMWNDHTWLDPLFWVFRTHHWWGPSQWGQYSNRTDELLLPNSISGKVIKVCPFKDLWEGGDRTCRAG